MKKNLKLPVVAALTLALTTPVMAQANFPDVDSNEWYANAIENAVNLASEKHTQYGKIAKDAAAGAVLISALCAVIVGIIILYQPAAFRMMFDYFMSNPLMLLVLVLSIIPASLFIFLGVPFRFGGKK